MFNSLWYQNLETPPLSPPSWVFTPVWSFLYITILVSFILFFINPAKNKTQGYVFFSIQIILNLVWSFIFFLLKNIMLAFLIIVLIDIALILTIKNFWRISKIAAVLLVPYLIWSFFATYLNFGYLILNM